ncbi:hypothetical protein B0H13DRAFT_2371700 [Mycena leptocephala]|nr:hypothetical protein B0H13DRAFT_2371700 [Mycena leptocephala]
MFKTIWHRDGDSSIIFALWAIASGVPDILMFAPPFREPIWREECDSHCCRVVGTGHHRTCTTQAGINSDYLYRSTVLQSVVVCTTDVRPPSAEVVGIPCRPSPKSADISRPSIPRLDAYLGALGHAEGIIN